MQNVVFVGYFVLHVVVVVVVAAAAAAVVVFVAAAAGTTFLSKVNRDLYVFKYSFCFSFSYARGIERVCVLLMLVFLHSQCN